MPLLPKPHPWNLGLKDSFPPFLLGFLATSSQILLLREFSAHFYGNELTFGVVLASWLLWGGLGSILASRWSFLQKNLSQIYYGVIFFIVLSLAGVRVFRFIMRVLPGELIGLLPVLGLSFGLCLLVSFPLGMLFVLNVGKASGRINDVYRLESLGATIAGLTVYFLFLPHFSAWQAAALIGGAGTWLLFSLVDKKKRLVIPALLTLVLTVFIFLDMPTQRLYWRPYHLLASRDTRYGKLQVIKTEEQTSLYSNSAPVYSHPDRASAEESVHFALLQKPEAERILLIGGGAGGTLMEILKYPIARVDYVELDPEVIQLSRLFLPEEEKRALSDARVHLFFEDGRAFLQKADNSYDGILISLPDPSTAQLNRFYTLEFFRLAKRKLTSAGVLSFIVASAEDYIGGELELFLASLYHTLKEVFPHVEVIPGARNVFLGSSESIQVEPEVLAQRVEALGLETLYFTRSSLLSRLHPLRRDRLETAMKSRQSRVNTDLAPISFYFQIMLWSAHFRGLEVKGLKYFSQLSPLWLLTLPLAFFCLVSVWLLIRKKKSPLPLVPLAVMGFTTIITEIILLVWFQALYGYLYGAIALLLSIFMLGLYIGSWVRSKKRSFSFRQLALIQAGFLFLLLVFLIMMRARPPEVLAFLILFALGYLGGDLFIVSNQLYLKSKADYGLGYGLDLLGSFGGALLTSTLLIPLTGLPFVLISIFLLNLMCLFLLLFFGGH